MMPGDHSLYRPKREQIDLMQWHVEQWRNGSIERILAICANSTLGRAAFNAAVAEWPDKELTLRHGSRVLQEHKPHGTIPA